MPSLALTSARIQGSVDSLVGDAAGIQEMLAYRDENGITAGNGFFSNRNITVAQELVLASETKYRFCWQTKNRLPAAEAAYRLQKVNSNEISASDCLGRISVSGVVKRMFRAYLLALISGMAASARFMRNRTNWAERPASMSW